MIKVIPNFITEEEEMELLSHLRPTYVTTGMGRNSIRRYGSTLPYAAPIESSKIPEWLMPVNLKVAEEWLPFQVPGRIPDSITINEYHKNQGIDWHIDSATSGPVITVLSLLSDAEMGLQSPDKKQSKILLPQRSLLLLTDEERWKWKHCIYEVAKPRFSIVFRKGINKPL